MERLDETKIELLRRWGEGLEQDGREELRAAGRAIMLLIDEIEQLHVDLWSAQSPSDAPAAVDPEVTSSLLARIGHLRRRGGGEATS